MFELTLDACALLLRQAVTPFIQIKAYHGEIYVTPNFVTLTAAASPGTVVLVLLMKPWMFHSFTCTENLALGFDLRILYSNLLLARNDALLRLSGDATSDHLDFALLHTRTLQAFRIHIPLLSRSSQMIHLPQFQNQYQITVGIPAEQFREIIMTLSRVGVIVSASITDSQVQFSVVNGNGNRGIISSPILQKPEQCIIKGDVGADPVFLVLDLRHAGAIVNASVMSNMVWLLGQSNGSSVKLDCPFGKLGNLYYHFHEA